MNYLNQSFNGITKSEEDVRDHTLKTYGIETGDIKEIILDLPEMSSDQGKSDMCTAYAGAIFDSILNKHHGYPKFTQADIYAHKGTAGEGGNLRMVLKGLQKHGACPIMFDAEVVTNYPMAKYWYENHKQEVDFYAGLGRITHYYRVRGLASVIKTLEMGKPILAGIKIFDTFIPNEDGYVTETTGNYLGGHAIVIIGYKNGYYRIINSWGKNWGDNGEVWIPEELVFEMWSAIDFEPIAIEIWLQINNNIMGINGKSIIMDTEPIIDDNDRTLVPVRAISEAFGANVKWYADTQVIKIVK